MSEFELIDRYFKRTLQTREDVCLGGGDDCAMLSPKIGERLLVSSDTLVSGRHFDDAIKTEDLGFFALKVNLSDLAAMGATPAWATLALTLPAESEKWLADFSKGFFALADHYQVALVGGDMTAGPLSITLTVMGQAPAACVLKRSGAKPGDLIFVSGTIGDVTPEKLYHQLPCVELGLALRDVASAAIDISDGVLADLNHILMASNVGADICFDHVPFADHVKDKEAALTAGYDYELCFTVSPEDRKKVPENCTCIGKVTTDLDLTVKTLSGKVLHFDTLGYQHF